MVPSKKACVAAANNGEKGRKNRGPTLDRVHSSRQGRRMLPKAGWTNFNVCGGGHNLPPLVAISLTDLPKSASC